MDTQEGRHRDVRPAGPAGVASRGNAHALVAVVIALLSALVIVLPLPLRETADVKTRGLGDYRCDDMQRVYHGHPPLVRSPCTVSADAVYRLIPEYQDIVQGGLSDDAPRYHFLMRKASRTFSQAAKAMARRHGHDVVAERGAVVPARPGVPEPPDRTQELIAELSR